MNLFPIHSHDLKIISGNFLYDEVPASKEYLLKHFQGEIERRFLVYYIEFVDMFRTRPVRHFCQGFMEHTGLMCNEQWVYKLLKKVNEIERMVDKAEKDTDLETLAKVKLGMHKYRHDKV